MNMEKQLIFYIENVFHKSNRGANLRGFALKFFKNKFRKDILCPCQNLQ